MGIKRGGEAGRLKARRRGLAIEALERRALLATSSVTFTGPSLGPLIAQAQHGKNTSQAQVSLMVDALRSQLQGGPLADLNSGAVAGNGFISEALALEASYEHNVDQQLAPKSPNLDELLKLQGQRVVDNLISSNQRETVGLISGASLASSSATTIASLSAGPIVAIGTKPAAITASAKVLKADLFLLEDGLGNGSLTLRQVNTTLGAEAEAFRADVHAGLQVTQLRVSGEADAAINALELTVGQVAQANPSGAQSGLSTAVDTFDNAVLGKSGLFGAKGALGKSRPTRLNPAGATGQAFSTFRTVSGTSTFGGTATLTATLTSSNGSPLMGESVAFTLDGAFAGVGVTNFHGVATVAGVPSTNAVGTNALGVGALFAGETNFQATAAPGNLVVGQVASAVSGVSGATIFGGPATLKATLTSAAGQALAGQAVRFSLDGNPVGTAVTDGNGLATLAGVPATNPVGTDAGGIVASFAGGGNYASSSRIGNLVVTRASTALANVGGTAPFGGTATLTATLTSSATGAGVVGQAVSFTLGGQSVGTALTNGSGTATLTGVASSGAVGTEPGAVLASFAGNTSYGAASGVVGNLAVSPANTALSGVGGTAALGGTATLTATLISLATNAGFANQAVNFTLAGKSVGTAVTNAGGVATLTGVPTTAGVGTGAGAVVANFAGNADYNNTISTGNLVVSRAASLLSVVSGSASFGGPATLMATLSSPTTNQPLSGQTVTFTLSGKLVGTAVTDNLGVATLPGVAESVAVGTLAGAVVANYAGNASNGAAPEASGELVVIPALTSLASVSGAAIFGGPATLSATLKSAANGQGVASERVTFTLNGNAVGSALTDGSGVATLTGVLTAAAAGTAAAAVRAGFGGDTNYGAANGGIGDLVVSKAGTALVGVSGTAPIGGPATLMATLTNSSTGKAIANETLTFTLDNKAVGTAATDSSGVAILSRVPTSDHAGTDSGGVVVTFAGDANANASQGTGNLIVI